MSKAITIAIDGYSSTGKGTLARDLAQHLDYRYIDSGAMYRAITLAAMRQGWVDEEHLQAEGVAQMLPQLLLSFEKNPSTGGYELFLNHNSVESEIRTMRVSNLVSRIAALPEVRRYLVAQLQRMGQQGGLVMDGRDIGTVVFPQAELKIFMRAEVRVRAHRRLADFQKRDPSVTLEEVEANLIARDHLDETRADSPLLQAKDARVLDNTHLTPAEQFDLALNWARLAGA
jgi:cytidylate kinase